MVQNRTVAESTTYAFSVVLSGSTGKRYAPCNLVIFIDLFSSTQTSIRKKVLRSIITYEPHGRLAGESSNVTCHRLGQSTRKAEVPHTDVSLMINRQNQQQR